MTDAEPQTFQQLFWKAKVVGYKEWQPVGRKFFKIDQTVALFDPERAGDDPEAVADHLMSLLRGFGGMLRLAKSTISDIRSHMSNLQVLPRMDDQNDEAILRLERCVRLLDAFMVSDFAKSLPKRRDRLFSRVLIDMILALLKFGCHTFDLAHDCVELETESEIFMIEIDVTVTVDDILNELYLNEWFAKMRSGVFYSYSRLEIKTRFRKDYSIGMRILQQRLRYDRKFCADFAAVLRVMSQSEELDGYGKQAIEQATLVPTVKDFVEKPAETLERNLLDDLWYLEDLAKLSDEEVPVWKAGAR